MRAVSGAETIGRTMAIRIVLLSIAAVFVAPSVQGQVELGGYVLTDSRARLEDGKLLWNENRLKLDLNASPTSEAHVFSEFWIRGFGASEAATTRDLMGLDKRKSNPWDLVLREAYVDLYGFFTPDLDLRIGRQRIAWGTADKINPTDNLNPDDLEDIWDFGRRLGTNSVLAQYYLGDVTLSAVFTPGFTPATLPPPDWAAALSTPIALPGGVEPSNVSDELDMPVNTLREAASVAVKIARPVLNYDLSLSYLTGRSDFPVPMRVVLAPVDSNSVNIHSTLVYPRMSVVGADLSGAIRTVGVWAEIAVFFPEAVYTTVDMSALGLGQQEVASLPDEHFARYVIGGDYTFAGGLYINAQFIHGFAHELGRDCLHNYVVAGLEKKLRNDTVKVTAAAAVEIPDSAHPGDNYAIIGMPEIAYYPSDNSEIACGVRVIGEKGQTSFGQLAEMDEGYIAFKYAF